MSMVTVPNTFATQSGNVPASELDANFVALANAINNYASDTGAANAYVIAPPSGITAYSPGQWFVFSAGHANTGASTIAVNGLSAKNIVKNNALALTGGEIQASGLYAVQYDGTNFNLLTLGGVGPIYGGVWTPSINLGSTLSGSVTINAALSNVFYGTLTGNITGLTISNLQEGQTINVAYQQDGTGSRTLAYTTTVLWPNGNVAQALTTGVANAIDLAVYSKINGNILANYVKTF